MPLLSRAHDETNAPPPSISIQPVDMEKEMAAKLVTVKKQAMADPRVKAAFKAASEAAFQSTQLINMKMKSIDLSVAPLLDRSPKQPLAQFEKQKLGDVRAKAMKDPQVKIARDQVNIMSKHAQDLLKARIKELDPSLSDLVDNPPKKSAIKKSSATSTNAPPVTTAPTP